MRFGRIEIVIEVHSMAGGSIEQGGPGQSQSLGRAHSGARTLTPLAYSTQDLAGNRRNSAGYHNGNGVDKFPMCRFQRLAWPIIIDAGNPVAVGLQGICNHITHMQMKGNWTVRTAPL